MQISLKLRKSEDVGVAPTMLSGIGANVVETNYSRCSKNRDVPFLFLLSRPCCAPHAWPVE